MEVSETAALAERRRVARLDAAVDWERANRRSQRGEDYLERRGLCASELILRGVVRFDGSGNPMVAIYDHSSGAVISIATRIIGATEHGKVIVTRDGTTVGTMIGRVSELDRQGPDIAIVVEGVTDGLAAVLAWPGCVVLAAHSAGQLARVVAEAAPRLREISGWLLIVPDRGTAGVTAGLAALEAAEAAGMGLDRDVHLVDLGPNQDLTDAMQAGWRWSWPA
jgi:hypothetical protein